MAPGLAFVDRGVGFYNGVPIGQRLDLAADDESDENNGDRREASYTRRMIIILMDTRRDYPGNQFAGQSGWSLPEASTRELVLLSRGGDAIVDRLSPAQ